jgi:hypothetical protein
MEKTHFSAKKKLKWSLWNGQSHHARIFAYNKNKDVEGIHFTGYVEEKDVRP